MRSMKDRFWRSFVFRRLNMFMKSIKEIAKKVNIGTASYDKLVNESSEWFDEYFQASDSTLDNGLESKNQAQKDFEVMLEKAGVNEVLYFLAILVGEIDAKKMKYANEWIENHCLPQTIDAFKGFLKKFSWFVTAWNKDNKELTARFIQNNNKPDQEVYESDDLPSNEEIDKQIKDYIGDRTPAFNLSDELGPDYEEVFIQYNKETNKLEFGSACNTGLLKDGEMEYDKTMDIQYNMEELYQTMIDYYRDHSDL